MTLALESRPQVTPDALNSARILLNRYVAYTIAIEADGEYIRIDFIKSIQEGGHMRKFGILCTALGLLTIAAIGSDLSAHTPNCVTTTKAVFSYFSIWDWEWKTVYREVTTCPPGEHGSVSPTAAGVATPM
jgi:hypothetical protein